MPLRRFWTTSAAVFGMSGTGRSNRLTFRNICWADFAGIDLIAGGPPCQPFAINGKHLGHKDRRDMWPEAIRAVHEAQPRGFVFESGQAAA